MLIRDEYPPGVPCWVDVATPDPAGTADFYRDLFGWRFDEQTPQRSPDRYLVASHEGRTVAGVRSLRTGESTRAAWNTYVRVDSADATAAKVVEAGGQVIVAPADVSAAGRAALFADPAGAVFGAWQPNGVHGAQAVNEPNTWNFNDLNTTDPERAKAFYGEVFGWQARPADLGFEVATMWCMPGYGKFVDRRLPGFVQGHVEGGSPEGFADAVGWLVADEDNRSRWSVAFLVADADAIVSRAERLGGSIDQPPVEAGGSAVAVLRDPHGAMFTVHTYEAS